MSHIDDMANIISYLLYFSHEPEEPTEPTLPDIGGATASPTWYV